MTATTIAPVAPSASDVLDAIASSASAPSAPSTSRDEHAMSFGRVLASEQDTVPETAPQAERTSPDPRRSGRPDAPGATDPQPTHGKDDAHAVGRTRSHRGRAAETLSHTDADDTAAGTPAAELGVEAAAADGAPVSAPATTTPGDQPTTVSTSGASAVDGLGTRLDKATVQPGSSAVPTDAAAMAAAVLGAPVGPLPAGSAGKELSVSEGASGPAGAASAASAATPATPATPAAAARGGADTPAIPAEAATPATPTSSAVPTHAEQGRPSTSGVAVPANGTAGVATRGDAIASFGSGVDPLADGATAAPSADPGARAIPATPATPSSSATVTDPATPASPAVAATPASPAAAALNRRDPRVRSDGARPANEAATSPKDAVDDGGTPLPATASDAARARASIARITAARPADAAEHATAGAQGSDAPATSLASPATGAGAAAASQPADAALAALAAARGSTPASGTTPHAAATSAPSPSLAADRVALDAIGRIRTTVTAGVPGLESKIDDPELGTIRIVVSARLGETVRAEIIARDPAAARELAAGIDRAVAAGATLPPNVDLRVRTEAATPSARADAHLGNSTSQPGPHDQSFSGGSTQAGGQPTDHDAERGVVRQSATPSPAGGRGRGPASTPAIVSVSPGSRHPGSALDVRA